MIHKVFTVYDSKAQAYLPPFFFQAVGAAVRAFSDAVNNKGGMFYKHASDFVLYQIGEYDDGNGNLSALSPYLNLGVASGFLSPDPVAPARVQVNGKVDDLEIVPVLNGGK